MDGLWNSGTGKEGTLQLLKDSHSFLRVNISNIGNLNPGDASTGASVNPNSPGGVSADQAGPHFMLSPETNDGSHTYGLEYTLVNGFFPAAERFTIPAAGLTVTLWELIGTSILSDPGAPILPVWASLLPQTGVGLNELYHTFDVNACAMRFQIAGSTDDVAGGSIGIFMREL